MNQPHQTNYIPFTPVKKTEALKKQNEAKMEQEAKIWSSFVKKFTVEIAELYGVTDQVCTTVFRNNVKSVCKKLSQNRYQVVMGWYSVEQQMEIGFQEYKSVYPHIKQLHGRKITGLEALYFIICHELAHAIEGAIEGWKYGVAHGNTFVKYYQEILEMYPWTEVKSGFFSKSDLLLAGELF